jgi:hypothetical protein
VILAAAGVGGSSCTGKSLTLPAPNASEPDASVSSQDAGRDDTGRVPKEHRASHAQCPTERGAVTPTSDGCPVNALHCAQDSDCADGKNGRCYDVGVCPSDCSYDDCFQDSDCENQTPCVCRSTATDENYCFTLSNCSVDADCGDSAYCSPSFVAASCICESPSCVEGYFCHTTRDLCVDDGDCPAMQSCGFDSNEQRFSCQPCLIRP